MKKIGITTLILLVISINNLYSQPPEPSWSQYYELNGGIQCHSATQLTDGGYLIAGTSIGFEGSNPNMYLIRTDSNGETLFTYHPLTDGTAGIKECLETADGNIVIAGYQHPNLSDNRYLYVEKMDMMGNHIWHEEYGRWGLSMCSGIVELEDGSFVIAGYDEENDNNDFDFFLIKIDSDGNEIWSRYYNYTSHDRCEEMIRTSDNGFLMVGYIPDGSGTYEEDIFAVKVDASGEVEWTTIVGGSQRDICYAAIEDDDNGYVLAGYTNSYGSGGYDMYVVKLDANGNQISQFTHGENEHDVIYCIMKSSDGNFISGAKKTIPADPQFSYLVKYDLDGNVMWEGGVDGGYGGTIYSLSQTSDGGFFAAGSSAISSFYDPRFLLYKFDEESFVDDGMMDIPSEFIINLIYPNPFNPCATVSLSLPNNSNLKLVLFNNLGQQVSVIANGSFQKGNHFFQINGSTLSSGNYFIQPIVNNQSGKGQRITLLK